MFPLNQDQNENINVAATQKNKFGKSFLFDFDKGDFSLIDGKLQVIEGENALKVWIKKSLKTEKFKYKIYDITNNTYGVKLMDYVTSNAPTGFIYAGIQTEISEALTVHPDITGIINFEFTREKRKLKVSFTVLTIYGDITEGVTL